MLADKRQAAPNIIADNCFTDGEPAINTYSHPIASTICPRAHGFTLIEVMITVAIIGILSAVALPAYNDYIIRGSLADASTGLSSMRAQMERYYQDNRTYASTGSFVTPCATTPATSRTFNKFVVSCAATPSATAFTLQAQGSGSVADFRFTINEREIKATTAAPSAYGTCATDWIMKKGQAC